MKQTARIPYRYLQLADELEKKITSGQFKAGEKLPSLRSMHRQTRLSITTITQAYAELEIRALVEPRLKSGYYVRPLIKNILPLPSEKSAAYEPRKVYVNSLLGSLCPAIAGKTMLPLGAALPATQLLPQKELHKAAKNITSTYFKRDGLNYGPPGGIPELKRFLAGRTLGTRNWVREEEIIITHGCMDAIQLCLRAISQPGDIVVTESPTFTCYLQLIEDLGLMALEVPASPKTGIDLAALEKALQKNAVSACLLNPNFQNPLGFVMPDENKKRVVEMTNSYKVPIIEDDIYGDLYFDTLRPTTIKSHDASGMVLYCSSFSKTLAPDLRIGWVIPGKYLDTIMRMQFNSNIAPPKLNQLIIADFLKNGYYDRHLRKFRRALQNQVSNTAQAIAKFFPEGTKLTAPNGGYILWVELDKRIDSMELFHEAKKANISILPGAVGSTTTGFNNCIRLNCGNPWSEEMERGIATLGEIISDMLCR